ncbi:Guanosine-5'-triphosphate,3'-diphosphate pyrophosphatase [bacterium HR32]|nr:Guanosine-5'-triphosphate,3'-diphosphate pyrophosphatase [bacterium HR32]
MRRAAIDVGTHSVRLLVADVLEGEVRPVVRRLEITRLGEGADRSRVLVPQAIGRTVRAVREFWRVAHEAGADRVVVVGTSAVREASNRSTLERDLHPIPLVVLDGDAEAELSFRGVRAGLRDLPDPLLVLDVGGGSTELVLGSGDRVVRKVSVPVGSVRLRERCLHSDPPADVEVQALRREVLDCVRPHRASLSGATRAVGVGGTVTSLAAVDLSLDPYDPDRVHGHVLSAGRVASLARGLCAMPLGLRRRIPGLQPERADVICAGALILETLVALFGLEAVVASESDLLWGALLAS